MGNYTDFVLNVKLKSDMPAPAIDMLLFLSDQGPEPKTLPDHMFFSSKLWRVILIGSLPIGSMPDTPPLFKKDDDDEDGPYWLSVRSEFRNYDREIVRFLDWLLPHLDAMDGDFLGYEKTEGNDELSLYYFKETIPFEPGAARYIEEVKIYEDSDGLVKQRAFVAAAPILLQPPDSRDRTTVHSSTQEPAVYLHPADKYSRLTHRPSQGQKGLEERTLMASQRPSHPW